MQQEDVAKRAKKYGIKAVPSVVIDGKIASCCANQDSNAESLRVEGLGVLLS